MIALLVVLAAAAASSSVLTVALAGEPGDPLVISEVIYGADGVSPVAGATLDIHHTDATGHYAPEGQPPRLKGTLVTGADGRYEIRTIRPAPYPGGRIPAHIHAKVSASAGAWHDIHEYWFADDPLVTAAMSAPHTSERRFNPIVTVTKGPDGVWRGERDIRLPEKARR
ncbi:MAG: hypothetical protein ACREAA_10990 [Candidatus Polarisedimenticolia bacterium]